jgi:uncharacterized protein GlcG (DUF336 family)
MRISEGALCAVAWILMSQVAVAESPFIDQALAESMVQQCTVRSHANAWPPFTLAVVDAAGALVLLRRQDGASPVTADVALLKARTALRFGAPTQALVSMSQDSATRDLLLLLQLTDDPGGMPVKSGGRIIGAIGVSGGVAEQDVGCATLAVDALTAVKQ